MIATYACATLATLAEDVSTHDRILRDRGGAFLVDLKGVDDPFVLCEALKCVCNLACNYATHARLLEDLCHDLLLHALRPEFDETIRTFGAIGLGNLLANPVTHDMVMRKDVVTPLGRLVADATAPGPQRYAVLALGSILGNSTYHDKCLDAGILVPLVQALSHLRALETRFYATFALGKLAMNATHQRPIARTDPAVDATPRAGDARREHPRPSAKPCRCCDALAVDDVIRAESMSIARTPSLLPALVIAASAAFHAAYIELDRELAALACNWTLSDAHKLPTAMSPLLSHLFRLSASSDIEVARNACGALANMAEETETHVSMLELHAMPNCVRLLRSRYVSVYREGQSVRRKLALVHRRSRALSARRGASRTHPRRQSRRRRVPI